MATYSPSSPYYDTNYVQFYLDVMTDRPFPKELDDTIFEKQRVRHHRLMDNVIKFHKNKNRKPNKWMNFVKFY